MSIPNLILKHLVQTEEYHRAAIPHLKSEYFQEGSPEKVVFEEIQKFSSSFNKVPTRQVLDVELQKRTNLSEDMNKKVGLLVSEVFEQASPEDLDWLLETTESYCQERSLYTAIRQSIDVIDGKDKKTDKHAIPKLIQEALAVSFSSSIGHDFIEDAEQRYDFYHIKEDRIKFDIDMFNRITRGGVPKKSLNIIVGGTNVGKTLYLCHFAAANLMQGKSVLYVTLEMAQERIAERIDQNLLDIDQDSLAMLSKEKYLKRIGDLKKKIPGKLIIKEYPTGCAGAAHIRYLLDELKTKKKFIPDVIYVDYLNICSSSRVKQVTDSYTLVKSIAEELRGLAVERNVAIWSATQANREGQDSSDFGLKQLSDSAGTGFTADFVVAITETDSMIVLGHQRVKQLKSRYNSKTKQKDFFVGVDKDKMKLFDVKNQITPSTSTPISKPVDSLVVMSTPTDDPPQWEENESTIENDGAYEPPKVKAKDGFDLLKPHGGLNTTSDWKL